MQKKLLALLFLVAVSFVASGFASGADQKKGAIITEFGEYKPFNGKLTLKVSEGDGQLTLSITPSSGSHRTFALNLPTKKGAFWLVYPEAVNKVWFFRDPALLEWTEQGNTNTATGHSDLERAPKALLDALPKDVRQRLQRK